MKAKVTLTFNVETEDYVHIEPTEEAVKELVELMLERRADLPDKIEIDVSEI